MKMPKSNINEINECLPEFLRITRYYDDRARPSEAGRNNYKIN